MKKRKTAVPFQGTAEQEQKLREIIRSHKDQQGALMPVLQQAQGLYGYLPIEVQKIIADEMNLPLERVYGVTTFYAQFSLNPQGKYQISVCLGTACYVRGSGVILERVEEKLGIKDGGITADGRFSLDSCRCLGCCGLAPVLTVNGEVHGRLTLNDVDTILDKYMQD